MSNFYFIRTPIGGGYGNLKPPSDKNIKFIEVSSNKGSSNISLGIFMTKEYSQMDEFFDPKYPYKGRHFIATLSLDEAIELKKALEEIIDKA